MTGPRAIQLPPIDATTRREFLVGGAAAALLLGACSSSGSGERSGAADEPSDTGAVEDSPATANVLALDEIAAIAVLSLGAVPAQAQATFSYAVAATILEDAGTRMISADPAGPDLESILRMRPSAIVGVSLPTTVDVQEDLDDIAPTTVIDFAGTWQDQLAAVAEAFAVEDEAAELRSRVEGEVAALRSDLEAAGLAGSTVSVITDSEGFFALSRNGLVGSLLAELGLGRPAAQDVDTDPTDPFIDIAAENLDGHDADHLVVLTGAAYPVDRLEASALWPSLGAVARGSDTRVVAEMWFSASALGVDWILADLRAALLGEGAVAQEGDALERWRSFAG